MLKREDFKPDILIGPSVLEQKDVDSINKLRRQLSQSPKEIVDISKNKLTDILCQPNCRIIIFKDPATDEVIGMASLFTINLFMLLPELAG